MRLDGLGKPPLAQAQTDNIGKTKVQLQSTMEVKHTTEAGDPEASASEREQDKGRLGQILDLLKRSQGRKKRKAVSKSVQEALKNYQKVAGFEELENQRGQTLDVKI